MNWDYANNLINDIERRKKDKKEKKE